MIVEKTKEVQMKVSFNLSNGRRRIGHVVRKNDKTVVVKMMKGAKTFKIIKRHIKKHNVWPYKTL